MKRRGLFQLLTSAIVASSMEVMGWSKPTINGFDKAFQTGGDIGYFREYLMTMHPPPGHPGKPYVIKYRRDYMPKWDWNRNLEIWERRP